MKICPQKFKTFSQVDLEIRVERANNFRYLVLKAVKLDIEQAFIISDLAEERLRDLRRSLPQRLQIFHAMVAEFQDMDEEAIVDEVRDSLSEVLVIGNDFINCFTYDPRDRARWMDLLSKAFLLPPQQRRETPARILLAVDPIDIDLLRLPLEILPIMDPSGLLNADPEEVRDLLSLQRVLLIFPAFASIITRRLIEEYDPFEQLERTESGYVPIKLVRNLGFYDTYDDAKGISEVEWLSRDRTTFEAEQPWPDNKITRSVAAKRLGRCLVDPRLWINEPDGLSPRVIGDQIQHFSCHYTTTDTSDVLRLRDDPPLDVQVGLVDLWCTSNRDKFVGRECHRPLIFLNACGSGGSSTYGGRSLTDLLLEIIKPRAIVATTTPVSYFPAARFARMVYQNLCSSLTIGEAVRLARWSMVDLEMRPFGLLYVVFGSSELCISPARATHIRS